MAGLAKWESVVGVVYGRNALDGKGNCGTLKEDEVDEKEENRDYEQEMEVSLQSLRRVSLAPRCRSFSMARLQLHSPPPPFYICILYIVYHHQHHHHHLLLLFSSPRRPFLFSIFNPLPLLLPTRPTYSPTSFHPLARELFLSILVLFQRGFYYY